MSLVILKKGELKKKYKEKLIEIEKKMPGLNAYKYCGKLKLTEDPLAYQKRVRNEWQ